MTDAAPPAPATFRPALIIGVITAGLLSFAAFIALLGWGPPEDQGGPSVFAAPPPTSAVGFKGVMDLAGRFVTVRAVTGDADLDSYDLLVVTLRPTDSPEEVAELLRRRAGQATILVLPKWVVEADPDRPGWIRSAGPDLWRAAGRLLGDGYVVEPMDDPGGSPVIGMDTMKGVTAPLPRHPQRIRGSRVSMALGVMDHGTLVARLGGQPHYVVADPDLLNNLGIATPEGARAALAILGAAMPHPNSPILFASSARGVVTPPGRNLVRALFEPPFLAMTIALVFAALLAGLHGAFRFGPARRAPRAIPFGKAALVENSAGLVRLARREVRLGSGYADLIRDEAARAGAAPSHLQGEALEDYLDRFAKPGEPAFRSLAYDLRVARDRHMLVAAARALFKWKKDIIR